MKYTIELDSSNPADLEMIELLKKSKDYKANEDAKLMFAAMEEVVVANIKSVRAMQKCIPHCSRVIRLPFERQSGKTSLIAKLACDLGDIVVVGNAGLITRDTFNARVYNEYSNNWRGLTCKTLWIDNASCNLHVNEILSSVKYDIAVLLG